MNELKLVSGDEAVTTEAPANDLSRANPTDALNRRDIELIKRSLVGMHKDCAELRSTIVALHGRQSQAPSRGFMLGLGLVALIAVAGLSIARPQLDEALHGTPALARLTGTDLNR